MVPKLVELHKKYADQGLVIVAVSNEAKGTIEAYIQENGINYPVANDPSGALMKTYGARGYPSSYLIDADGNLIFSGHPSRINNSQIEDNLKKVTLPVVDDLPESMKSVSEKFKKLKYGECYKELQKILNSDKSTEEEFNSANKLTDFIEKNAEKDLNALNELREKKDFIGILQKLPKVEKKYKGCDLENLFSDFEKELKSDKNTKKEIAIVKKFLKLEKEYNKMRQGTPVKSKIEKLKKKYKKFIKMNKDSSVIPIAKERVKEFEEILKKIMGN